MQIYYVLPSLITVLFKEPLRITLLKNIFLYIYLYIFLSLYLYPFVDIFLKYLFLPVQMNVS